MPPVDYYFRTTPYFETSSQKCAWLNKIVAVGVGQVELSKGRVGYSLRGWLSVQLRRMEAPQQLLWLRSVGGIDAELAKVDRERARLVSAIATGGQLTAWLKRCRRASDS